MKKDNYSTPEIMILMEESLTMLCASDTDFQSQNEQFDDLTSGDVIW